jgi:hypothetical protein
MIEKPSRAFFAEKASNEELSIYLRFGALLRTRAAASSRKWDTFWP